MVARASGAGPASTGQTHLHLDAPAAISTAPGPASTSTLSSSSSASWPIKPSRSPPCNSIATTNDIQSSSRFPEWAASLPHPGCTFEPEEEDQLMIGGGGSSGSGGPSSTSSQQGGMLAAEGSTPQRRKRARHGIKIKRNRKITSCLACRERKQKCDRTHPVCEKCIEDGRQCTYVDNESTLEDEDGIEESRAAVAGPSGVPRDGSQDGTPRGSSGRGAGEAFYERRRAGVRHSYDLSRCRKLPFQDRVKAARAAAVSEVLFQQNGAPELPCNAPIRLPTREQAQPLLDLYKAHVESICNIVLVDLNRARIGSFLDWWHSNPDTLPPEADSPLAPLVLVVLALGLQAHRAKVAMDNFDPNTSRTPADAKVSHHVSVHDFVSPERFLLETAGRCINALQITCPSSWATTYSAPLDVIRAETLRALWHLGECHLQFANSCFTVAVRLAYAAGLHRDPTHFREAKMSTFEMQARRSAWWNLATLEVFHAFRIGQPTSLSLNASDTQLPTDFGCIADQYEVTRNEHGRPNKIAHDALIARFHLARLMISKGSSIFGISEQGAIQKLRDVQEIGNSWNASLPPELVSKMNAIDAAPSLAYVDEDTKWQSVGLQLNHLQLCMSGHRIDEDSIRAELAGTPISKHPSSNPRCLDAARRLIALCYKAIIGRPAAPCLVLNVISYYAFNTGCMLAMQSVSSKPMPEMVNPILQETLAVLDQMGNNEGLFNISEQAERYAKTIRELMRNRPPPPEGQPLHARRKVPPSPKASASEPSGAVTVGSGVPIPAAPGGSGTLAAQTEDGLRPSPSPALAQRGSSVSSWSPPDQPISASPMSAPAASTATANNVTSDMETFRPASYPRAISSTSSTDGRPREGVALARSPTSMSTLSSSSSSHNRELFTKQTDFNSMEERMVPNNNISAFSFMSSLLEPQQLSDGLSQAPAQPFEGIAHPQQQLYDETPAAPPSAVAASASSAPTVFSSPLQGAGMGSSSTDWSRATGGGARHHSQSGSGTMIQRPHATHEHSHAFQPMGTSSADVASFNHHHQRMSSSPHPAQHYHQHQHQHSQQHSPYQQHQQHHHHYRHVSHGAAPSSTMPPPMLPHSQGMQGDGHPSWPNSMTAGGGDGGGNVNSYTEMTPQANMGSVHTAHAHPHVAAPSSNADMDAAAQQHHQQQSMEAYIAGIMQSIS